MILPECISDPINPAPSQEMVNLQDIRPYNLNHLPIAAAFIRRLDIRGLVDEWLQSNMEVSPGLIVEAMILDTLSGRSPLYRLQSAFSNTDQDLLLGEKVDPEKLSDHNVGRVLDKIQKTGPSSIFASLGVRAVNRFNIPCDTGHWDTTSVSVWGDYDLYGDDDAPGTPRLRVVHGYSKDHRPDLKQFLLSMMCVGGNIPILGDSHNGNASDKTLNNNLLTRISRHLAQHGIDDRAFIYVADCALVTEDNLKFFAGIDDKGQDHNTKKGPDQTLRFITRLPFTYEVTEELVKEAMAADQWEDIGTLAQGRPTAKRPHAQYKSYETTVSLYGKTYRAVVLHSSAHDKRRLKRLERQIRKTGQQFEQELKKVSKRTFYCEADAQVELAKLHQFAEKKDREGQGLYAFKAQVVEEHVYARGRPRKDGSREVQQVHYYVRGEVVERRDVIEFRREHSGCFVLITNVPKEGDDSASSKIILEKYKEQNGIERNYRFLKDPVIVNDLFLKKPERIEALGMILLMAVLVWNLMERTMRANLCKLEEGKIDGWDKKETKRPTTFMMTTKFTSIMIIKIGDERRFARPLTKVQRDYLKILELTEDVFLIPQKAHSSSP